MRLITKDNMLERCVVLRKYKIVPQHELSVRKCSRQTVPFKSGRYSWNWARFPLMKEVNYCGYECILYVWNEHPYYRGFMKKNLPCHHYWKKNVVRT